MMEKYQEYKPSNIDFIGDIPTHWEIRKLKYCMKDKITDGPHETPKFIKEGVPFLSVDGIQNGELIFENCRKISKEDHINYSKKALIEYDDILLGKAASIGKIARVKVEFEFSIWSPLALIKANKNIILPTYLEYSLKTKMVQYQIETLATNNTQKNISMADIPRFLLTIPPLDEQAEIALFLDIKNREIEEFIANKQEQIALLEEQKEAIINRAVTKGLDDSVEFKDSGIDWIGAIPLHWKAKKLKYCAKVVLGKMLCNTDKGNYKLKSYLKSKNIQWMKINTSSVEKMWFSEYEMSLYKLNKDDLVLSEGGEVGKTSLWNDEIEECYIQNSVHKVTVNDDNLPKYYLYLFFIYGKVGYFNSIVNKVSIAHLTKEKLENFECVVAPKDEQEQIIKYIEIELSKIDEAITQIQKEIDLIKEYKISLISEVVTGQIDVRKREDK